MEYARASHARRGSGPAPARAGRPAPSTAPFDPRDPWVSPLTLLHLQQTAGNGAAGTMVQRVTDGPGVDIVPGEPQIVGPEDIAATPGPATATATANRTLRYGDTGEDVKVLQMKLKQIEERGNDIDVTGNSRIDGIFGPLTRQDVLEFQRDTGLDADAVVGPRTWNALHSLVTGSQDEATERALDARYSEAVEAELAGRYDEAIALFEAIDADQQQTGENANEVRYHEALCNQQRGRFGFAVRLYEQGLKGRFNQEEKRGQLLDNLRRARANQFLDEPAPDPEPVPVGPGVEAADRYQGGGVTERTAVHAGDTGEAADLFKGKLAHAMSSWLPPISDGDQIDADTVTTIRQFQEACGLPQSGDGDATTWHALDAFSPRDIPHVVTSRLAERHAATANVEKLDLPASIPLWEQLVSDTREAGLVENAKYYEFRLGRAYHRLGHFEQALMHYEAYVQRVIPDPSLLGYVFESVRLARERQPAPKG